MNTNLRSIRPFIGALNYEVSRHFYKDFGFEETVLSENMSVFRLQTLSFYLQKAYIKDWIDNSMVFLEVENIKVFREDLLTKNLSEKYINVRLSVIVHNEWGSEFFVHDPSGILWHIGEFN